MAFLGWFLIWFVGFCVFTILGQIAINFAVKEKVTLTPNQELWFLITLSVLWPLFFLPVAFLMARDIGESIASKSSEKKEKK